MIRPLLSPIFIWAILLIIAINSHSNNSLIADTGTTHRLRCRIVTPLEYANTPLDPLIDFGDWIPNKDPSQLLDPSSIVIINLRTAEQVPYSLSADFQYGNSGRVLWVANHPEATEYEIRFRTTNKRTLHSPAQNVPRIGVGDLLRYNTDTPHAVTTFYAASLVDLNSDGQSDLAGCWNYAYAPEETWNGVIAHLRLDGKHSKNETLIRVGERTQLRYQRQDDETNFRFFEGTYQSCDFGDLNGDNLIDLVQTDQSSRQARFFLNSGKSEPSGLPIYEFAGSVPVSGWEASRIVDLDGNGTLDLVVNGNFIPNKNHQSWPFEPGEVKPLKIGEQPDFLDLNGDQKLDAVILVPNNDNRPDGYQLAWCPNVGDGKPEFGPPQTLPDITAKYITYFSVSADGETPGLVAQHDVY
ncbi:MAG: VCBS repeat-containing protein [Planctomycetaceae bacterium]|nr:VCBS repeat-containing protein [Planctomycetaceae bacterium]